MQNKHPPLLDSVLEQELQREFGTLLPSPVLVRVLGYPTPEAFRKALSRKRLPIPVFQIPGRRGHFALVKDVAQWLTSSRNAAAAPARSIERNLPLAKRPGTPPAPSPRLVPPVDTSAGTDELSLRGSRAAFGRRASVAFFTA